MAIVTINNAEIVGSYDANGNIALTDDATGLLDWGIITYHMLRTPSLIRTELSNHEVLVVGDRRGTWSLIKSIRDKLLADVS